MGNVRRIFIRIDRKAEKRAFINKTYGEEINKLEPQEKDQVIKECHNCGVVLNRSRVIVTLVLLPFFILFFWVDSILIAIAQDPYISECARNYVVWTIPGVWCFVQFDCMKRFLQSMQFFTIPMYVQLIATGFHVLWCWLFISYL